MEEWQNGHDQPGYHYHQEQERKPVETPGKRFWKMWGPLLIKWGIGIGVGMAVMAAMMMAYMKTHYQTSATIPYLSRRSTACSNAVRTVPCVRCQYCSCKR